jgi:hypothetical protein
MINSLHTRDRLRLDGAGAAMWFLPVTSTVFIISKSHFSKNLERNI